LITTGAATPFITKEVTMHFKLTKEQTALKKEFGDFFREEMKNAPAVYH